MPNEIDISYRGTQPCGPQSCVPRLFLTFEDIKMKTNRTLFLHIVIEAVAPQILLRLLGSNAAKQQ